MFKLKTLKKQLDLSANELLLVSLFAVYLLFDVHLPGTLSNIVDNTIGKIVVVFVALSLFYTKKPIIVVLGLFVAFTMIQRASIATGSHGIKHHLPSEASRDSEMTEMDENNEESSLEEDVVEQIPVNPSNGVESSDYKPVTDKTHRASSVNGKLTL
jgi:hypothetical protein